MDWDLLINITSDLIRDENIRYQVYKRFIEASEYSEKELIKESAGQDSAFDEVLNDIYEDEDVIDFISEEDTDYEFNE